MPKIELILIPTFFFILSSKKDSGKHFKKKSENERKNLVFEFSSILGECPRDSRRSKRRLEGGWLDSSACQISGSEI